MMSSTDMFTLQTGTVINRVDEIREATQRLDLMLADISVPDCVLYYYGVSNVGKTTVLGEIRRECARRGVPSGLVDFDRWFSTSENGHPATYRGSAGKLMLVKDIMGELARSADYVPRQIITLEMTPEEAADQMLRFAVDFYRFRQQGPFALVFDTVEDSDPDTFLWLQRSVLERFITQFHVLVIIAGRTEPNTIDRDLIYPLERRVKKIQLRPFDSHQIEDQLKALGAEKVAFGGKHLVQITGGLPGLVRQAVEWQSKDHPTVSEPELRKQLLQFLVHSVIFQRLAAPVSPNVTGEILAVSVLRQFDSGLLSRLVQTMWPEKYRYPGIRPIRELLKRMQQTRLVEPHPDGYGYTVPRDLRMVLDLYWQIAEPEKHVQIHQIAADWYAEQVSRDDFVAIADRIYHLGGLQRDVDLQGNLKQHLASDLLPEPASLDRLTGELHAVLEDLLKGSTRAFDLATKIERILEQRDDFERVLDSETITRLTTMCKDFYDNLP